jgi:Tol biopolymer transport system component
MSMPSGTRLGPYEIVAAIGAGGMGEVYKARDTRLDRAVAIKILPESLASDPQFRERFDREARAISQLTDPHICTLYDIGESVGTAFLVMEYLEGETLEQRLKKGALPLDEVLKIAIQIADALSVAHRHGIVHRDLKPGNVMLTKTGAKLLDFGLAKTTAPGIAGAGLSLLPTTPANLTAQGTILGTFQYMAPEQLEGKDADPRTDIFGFGAVLYEMLTGRKAFEGKTQATLIAAIIGSDPPPVSQVQPVAPPMLDLIVRTCLEKDPDARFQSARDIGLSLRWLADGVRAAGDSQTRTSTSRRRDRVIFGVAGLLGGVVLATWLVTILFRTARESLPMPVRAVIPTPTARSFADLRNGIAISPDGRQVAYTSGEIGVSHLYVRPLDRADATLVRGTDGAEGPFFSPDGQHLGFFTASQLKQVPLDGGAPVKICDAIDPRGAAWGPDGTIIFTPSPNDPLWRVPASGGTPERISTLDTEHHERTHRFPTILPDGRTVLFVAATTDIASYADAQIIAQPIAGGTRKVVVQGGTSPQFAMGQLVYNRGDALVAAPFDVRRLEVTGRPVVVATDVAWSAISAITQAALARDGTLAYLPGGETWARQKIVWVDRSGQRTAVTDATGGYNDVRVSPDGTRLLLWSAAANDMLLVYDLERGRSTRLPLRGNVTGGAWTPDGRRVIAALDATLVSVAADGSDDVETIATDASRFYPHVAPDGDTVAFGIGRPDNRSDIWTLSVKTHVTKPCVATRFNERVPRYSPDGRWLAYESDESGVVEIYVRPANCGGAKTQISTGGGHGGVWSSDSRALFFASSNSVSVVNVNAAAGLIAGEPHRLFSWQSRYITFDVMPDSRRFVMFEEQPAPVPSQINLVLGGLVSVGRR